jgi:chemotaxis protein MotB
MIQMRIKNTTHLLAVILLISAVACVPARKLDELQVKYDQLDSDYSLLKTMKEYGDTSLAELKNKYTKLQAEYTDAAYKCEEQKAAYEKTEASYKILNENYKNLANSNENTKKDLRYELERLDKELDIKKGELFAKEAKLEAQQTEANKLKTELEALSTSLKEREKRVNELEAKLAAQEKSVSELKNKLTESLIGYKNSGISVIEKNGKIYVSLDNSLLFASGKTDIDWKGKTALLKVAESLQDLEDFDIVVEGHTDNQAMNSSIIKDNWDLSVLRATSVVRYMTTDGKMDPIKIIPSGRSKYVPINAEDTKEARAENRRIEIILTPKLDQLMDIIK